MLKLEGEELYTSQEKMEVVLQLLRGVPVAGAVWDGRALSLQDNNLGSKDAQKIANALDANSTLIDLDMSENGLGDDGAAVRSPCTFAARTMSLCLVPIISHCLRWVGRECQQGWWAAPPPSPPHTHGLCPLHPPPSTLPFSPRLPHLLAISPLFTPGGVDCFGIQHHAADAELERE
jgi:hypothetical protein